MNEAVADNRAGPALFGRLSLRARIVLWILLLFLIIQVTLSLVILLYARQSTQQSLQRSLDKFSGIAEAAAAQWQRIPDRESFEVELSKAIPDGFDDVYGIVAQHTSPDGPQLILQGGPLGDELLEIVQERRSVVGPTVREQRRSDGIVFRESERIRLQGGDEIVLTMALSSTDQAKSVRLIATIILFGVPVSSISLSVAAWVVSGIAVRPLQQVEDFAAQLSPENVGTPIELQAGGSEVEALRTQLNDAMDRMDQAYQEQARFLANVSHEIKTPISVVLAEAEVLLMKPREPSEVTKFVKSTAEEMQRLGSMVESFLLLTRVEHGEGRVRRKRLDLNELLMEAVEDCNGMAGLHDVALRPELCDNETTPSVLGNDDLLRTAIGNLIRNAIRFSPANEAVEVSCAVESERGVIRIRDFGPGIPEDLLPRLFEPFTQASSERRRGRGTGLGLQIAKGIAELHEGDIGASNLDRGCQFSLELPLESPERSA